MPTFDEREHLVRQFCKNTGATDRLARDVLGRNKWNLERGYKEVEQMCVSSNRGSSTLPSSSSSVPPPPAYPANDYHRHPPMSGGGSVTVISRGGTEGGVGPAVTLDTRGIRPSVQSVQGLKVDLPPKRPVERVIPIQVEGGRTIYPSAAAATTAMARATLDEKVLPSQPGMVPPKISAGSSVDGPQSSKDTETPPPPTSHPHLEGYPRLKRGFSNILENEALVSAARSSVLQEIAEDSHAHMFMTFTLPDLTLYPLDFQAFLRKELIESSTLTSLQTAGRLNWWAELGLCQRLIPMATTGDGNCLLHAASLAMWGIHDRLLTLRNLLHHTLTAAGYKDHLYRRWRWQQTLVNQQSALVFSEAEWQAEWENILRLASPSPRSGPDHGTNANSCCDSPLTSTKSGTEAVVYESLEELHVFVLAHVLQRPIVVVADTVLRDAAGGPLAPIPFGGIYLPLECKAAACCKSPLLLTYDAAHFSALVPMAHADPSVPLAIPVVDPQLRLLPLHFSVDPGPNFAWNGLNNKTGGSPCLQDSLNLLKAHMDVVQLPLSLDTPLISDSRHYTVRQTSAGSTDDYTACVLSSHRGLKQKLYHYPHHSTDGHECCPCQRHQTQETWSDDSGGFNTWSGKERRKEGKNTVARQFGSLGKSVGKKLKNLGNNLAPSKGGHKEGSVSSGLTPGGRVALAAGPGEGTDSVYCASLNLPEDQEDRDVFVSNYLKDANRRFLQQQEQRRLRGDDLRPNKVNPYLGGGGGGGGGTLSSYQGQGRACRTPGCPYPPLLELSLCERCASQQQWGQGGGGGGGTLERVKGGGGGGGQQPLGYNTFPGRYAKAPPSSSSSSAPLPPDSSGTAGGNDMYKCGKSKFYTTSHPDSSSSSSPYPTSSSSAYPHPLQPQSLSVLRQLDRQQSLSTGNVAHQPPSSSSSGGNFRRPRSPSPDYDNRRLADGSDGVVPLKCATPGCQFYGSKETGLLCSGCFRNKPLQPSLAKPEKTTRL